MIKLLNWNFLYMGINIYRVIIYFYLEDDSVHIIEPKIMNSGIPQCMKKYINIKYKIKYKNY